MRDGLVGAWSYVWPYTIEANGTSGDPVAPPPSPHTGNAPGSANLSIDEALHSKSF